MSQWRRVLQQNSLLANCQTFRRESMGSQASEASGRVEIQIWLMSEAWRGNVSIRHGGTEARNDSDRSPYPGLWSENARTILLCDGIPRTLFPCFPRPCSWDQISIQICPPRRSPLAHHALPSASDRRRWSRDLATPAPCPTRSRFLKTGTSRSLTFSLQSLTPHLNIDLSSARCQRPQHPCLRCIWATHLFLERLGYTPDDDEHSGGDYAVEIGDLLTAGALAYYDWVSARFKPFDTSWTDSIMKRREFPQSAVHS